MYCRIAETLFKEIPENAIITDLSNSPVKGRENRSNTEIKPDSGYLWDGWNYPEGAVIDIYGSRHECRGGWWVNI